MSAPDDGFLDDWVRRALEELAAKHEPPWVDAAGPDEKIKSSSEGEEAA